MLGRFFHRALVALMIYCCVIGMLYWSPWLTAKMKPYLCATLTESIEFSKVKEVVTDLLFYSSAPQAGYVDTGDMKDAEEPTVVDRPETEWPTR